MNARLLPYNVALASVVLSFSAVADPSAFAQATGILAFDLLDERQVISHPLDQELLLRAVRISHERVTHFGWDVQVVRQPATPSSRNLLRHPLADHGAGPHDVLAWLVEQRAFPNERTLPVHGFPYEIRIRLTGVRITHFGNDIGFAAGRIEIRWSRLDLARQNDRVDVVSDVQPGRETVAGP